MLHEYHSRFSLFHIDEMQRRVSSKQQQQVNLCTFPLSHSFSFYVVLLSPISQAPSLTHPLPHPSCQRSLSRRPHLRHPITSLIECIFLLYNASRCSLTLCRDWPAAPSWSCTSGASFSAPSPRVTDLQGSSFSLLPDDHITPPPLPRALRP